MRENVPPPSTVGQHAEALAQRFLAARGLTLLTSNYRTPRGEIDLIMQEGSCLVFVEVRYRASARYGSGAESIDARKQSRLAAAALYFLQRQPSRARLPARFDVIAISGTAGDEHIDWIRNAFEVRA